MFWINVLAVTVIILVVIVARMYQAMRRYAEVIQAQTICIDAVLEHLDDEELFLRIRIKGENHNNG